MTMARRTLNDLAARANELADRFENYEPKPEDIDAPLPPAMAVQLAAWKRDAAERDLAAAVTDARRLGTSWRVIGEAIGTTGEAARQRYSHV